MALTRLGRNLIIVVGLAAISGGGYYLAKQRGVFDKKEPVVTVDVGNSQPVQDAPAPIPSTPIQAPAPAYTPPPAEQPVAPDASTNRGVQFLLNQGKQ